MTDIKTIEAIWDAWEKRDQQLDDIAHIMCIAHDFNMSAADIKYIIFGDEDD